MRLEHKLSLSTGMLVVVMIVSAASATLRIHSADQLDRATIAARMARVNGVWDLRTGMARSVRELESEMLFGPAKFHAARQADLDLADQALNNLVEADTEAHGGTTSARVVHMAGQFSHLHRLEEHVDAQLHEPDGAAAARKETEDEVLPLTVAISAEGAAYGEEERRGMEADGRQLAKTHRTALLTMWTVTLCGALAGLLVALALGRHITEAVEQVARRADAIAGGDLTGGDLELGRRDQVGTLADTINRMQHSLGAIIGTVAETAGSLTGSAVSMRSASDQIHRRIDQQSQQTQQAATAMQEMSASIAEVSRHTQSAAETARSAAQTARDGGVIVKQMLNSMHQIATAVEETSETVGLLGEDSKRISQIVTVIDEIARKTNLLALNASIEAARAGEQGRGFAVVAGEVRRLAESTAQATGEIASMIQGIQDRTRRAVASMHSGTGTVEEGVITTGQAGEALEKIIGMAEQVDRMITQIAIAASQQASAADQSSASLDSIYSLSSDNLNEMATTAAGIESLRGTAVKLERQVDRFHLSDRAVPA